MSIFKENVSSIVFENKHLQVVISKASGKVEKAVYLPEQRDVLASEDVDLAEEKDVYVGKGAPPFGAYFSYLITEGGERIIPPVKVEVREDVLRFTYENGIFADVLVEVFDNFFTAELVSGLSKDINGIVFFNIQFNYTPSYDPESFRASGVSMDAKVNNNFIPGGWCPVVRASARTSIGRDLAGAKIGVVFSKEKEHRAFLKEVINAIDPRRSIVSSHGGPFALDNDDIFGDYVILFDNITPENVEETAKLAAKYSIDQVDIHHGPDTFIQGDFNFVCAATEEEKKNNTFISGTVFKERIADKFLAEGLQLGLHTYSSTISALATTITSDPKWQKNFVYNDVTFSLRQDINNIEEHIPTNEDASEFRGEEQGITYYTKYTGYVLIDEEIVLVPGNGVTEGLQNVKRGQLGTKAVPHKKGAVIRQFLGKYGCLQSVPGSDLFYHVARETARACNEGGFDMIYFDGYESMYWLLEPENLYYYYTEFVREVLLHCKKKPIIEFSTYAPCLWGARGRGSAIDHGRRAYKRFNEMHYERCMTQKTFYYTATLGWFHYAPDSIFELKNTINKSIFRDDLDHMGSLAIESDFSTVCMPFSVPHFTPETRLGDNFMYYGVYSRLRKAKYFAREVKQAIKTSPYEHRAVKCADGSFGMQEMFYVQNKVQGSLEDSYATGRANNPFEEQVPFIRIEQRYSASGDIEKTLVDFEKKELEELQGKHEFAETDLSDYRAFKITVKGNGSKSGAVLLRLEGNGDASGWTDYLLPLCHEGEKEFILIDADNADYDGYDFAIAGYENHGEAYRWFTNLSRVCSVTVSLTGDTKGAKIGKFKACKIVDAPVKDPSVIIGDKKITFHATVHSGEYVEYYPEKKKAYLYSYEKLYEGNSALKQGETRRTGIAFAGDVDTAEGKWIKDIAHTCEIPFSGEVTVPAGEYAFTYDTEALTAVPARALVKIGVAGRILKNPEGFVAPEVDMPDDILEISIK
ncbi:MAG: hypothetical protein E7293_10225 [Lachnospiraceae bacterium]|nr:hypothetical protein [Lachnospiraceae bacterium]